MIDLVKTVGKAINTLATVAPDTAGKLTLNIFCRPKEGRKFTPKETTFLAKAKWIDLKWRGKKIQCYTWGTGNKKILLAHGFNSNAARWRPLVELLEHSDYQIIALDAPAHGNSAWNRVNGLLYAQVLEVVIEFFRPNFIIGHSFAGIALTYYFSNMKAHTVQRMILMGVPNKLKDINEVFFKMLDLKPAVQKAYFKAFYDKFGHDTDYFTLSTMGQNISIPSLIIHDELDDIASYEGAEELAKSWQNTTFLGTKNLGHSLQGKIVYQKILEFLE